ncbi:MAG: hypothetical protein FWC98_00790 [Bacteroidales bacterium]|nr:hypothetical protein [Bacteroidales bacterium]
MINFLIRLYLFVKRKTAPKTNPVLDVEFLDIHVVYRISDAGYPKIKEPYINNQNCLVNAVSAFPPNKFKWKVFADNCSSETLQMIYQHVPKECVECVSVGHGAGTFRLAMNYAFSQNDEAVIYFLENDYIHQPQAAQILKEGFSIPHVSFVTLYDCLDKYINGVNPFVRKQSEKTRVYLTKSTHWKETNSATMTFATKVTTLKKTQKIFKRWSAKTHPWDLCIFTELKLRGHILISPIPSQSTHGETEALAPLVEWERFA